MNHPLTADCTTYSHTPPRGRAPLAGVIDRTHGNPWPASGMTTALWLKQPARWFTIADLTATQPGILFSALLATTPPYGGDPLPHIVIWQGNPYLEDGHHRIMRALIAGHTQVRARWITAA